MYLFYFHFILMEIPVIKQSVYPDQTPRSVASDLSLQCLPRSIRWSLCTFRVNGKTCPFDQSSRYQYRIVHVCKPDIY